MFEIEAAEDGVTVYLTVDGERKCLVWVASDENAAAVAAAVEIASATVAYRDSYRIETATG